MQDMSSVRGSESGPDTDIRTKVFCEKRAVVYVSPFRHAAQMPFSVLLLALFLAVDCQRAYFMFRPARPVRGKCK